MGWRGGGPLECASARAVRACRNGVLTARTAGKYGGHRGRGHSYLRGEKDKRLRDDSREESDCRRPRERNARCRMEAAHSNKYAIPCNQRSLASHRMAEALDNLVRPSLISYTSSSAKSTRYCGRVVMASRLGFVQSVMGNLASSNLVSANFFIYLVSCLPQLQYHTFQPQL
jgi:hypothetical protein